MGEKKIQGGGNRSFFKKNPALKKKKEKNHQQKNPKYQKLQTHEKPQKSPLKKNKFHCLPLERNIL